MHNDYRDDDDNDDDYLNRTVNNSFMPKATSTELIDKRRHAKARRSASTARHDDDDDSVEMCLDADIRQHVWHCRHGANVSPHRIEGIDPKYLVRTVKPSLERLSEFESSTESLNESLSNTNQPCLCDASFCHCREEYLKRYTNDISRMTMVDASGTDSTLLDNALRLMAASPRYNKENESSALLDNLLASDEEHGKDDLEITKYAYNYLSSLKEKRKQKAALQVNNVQQRQHVQNRPIKTPFRLTVNRAYVVWAGSQPRDTNVKSFSLCLASTPQKTAFLSIHQSQPVFHFSNESGSVCQDTLDIVLYPKKERKVFIKFRPEDSLYNSGTVRVLVDGHKYNVGLSGYMGPARIQLADFKGQPHPEYPGTELLVRHIGQPTHGHDHDSILQPGCGVTSISVCNAGARTAFVTLLSLEKHVTFEPRALLVISESTVEVKVSWTNDSRGPGEPISRCISFMFVQVDEAVRRACRQSCLEFPHDKKYDMFSTYQVFSELPEEKQIRLNEMPRIDWRPYLAQQINVGYRNCSIDLTPVSDNIKVEKNESTLSLEEVARSTMTDIGSLSHLKLMHLKPFYFNGLVNYINNLRDQLPGIVVLKDVIRFPVTRVSAVSYQAILIRNFNQFSVYFGISPLSRTSIFMRHQSSDTLTSMTPVSSNGMGSQSPENGEDRGPLIGGRALCNSAQTIKVRLEESRVIMQPQESLLVPVTFSPAALGSIQCKCIIKFQCDESNLFYEKEIDFSGEAGHEGKKESLMSTPQPSEDCSRSIPGITVISNVVEFGDIGPERTVSRSLLLKSRLQHAKNLFISRLSPPFEFRCGDKVTLSPGPSALKIYFNSKKTPVVFNEAVLLLSDEEGNCTHVTLRARLKR